MRKSTHLACMTVVLLSLMSLIAPPAAFGYPPDNAAVLYYKAAGLCRIDSQVDSVLTDLRKGKAKINDEIRKVVEENRETIIALLDACEVKKCDWGINYARGFELMPPRYATLRQLSTLVVAEARIHAQDRDYRTALDRCLSLHKMAAHVNDRLFISHLVGIAINAMAHDCMTEVLSAMPPDAGALTWLKAELTEIEDLPLSIGPALDGERQAGAVSITMERMASVVKTDFGDETFRKTVLKRVRAGDEEFFNKNRAAWIQYWDEITAAFALPYPEAHLQLKRVYAKFESKPDAVLMTQLLPSCEAMCTQWTKSKARYNAIRVAIDLYLTQAKTGSLPNELPPETPHDPFSGKPFRYKKTADGFVLQCQGKDLDKDRTYEYAFAIEK